jgi:hypothetical protein
MKKFLLIAGILLILIAGGVWGYVFIFGVPKDAGDIFSNFNFGGEPVFTEQPSIVDTSPVDQGGNVQKLRQLTTRPIIGAVFVGGGVKYAEQGTGHIYDIMFSNGNESLVNGTTIPRATEAIFSPVGDRVAITSEEGGVRTTVITSLVGDVDGVPSGKTLPIGAREISFDKTGEKLFYLIRNTGGAKGYAYDIPKDANVEIFSIPLSDVRVLWGEPIYIYTTPSATQTGYVYSVVGGVLNHVGSSGRGISAIRQGKGLLVSHLNDGVVESFATSGEETYTIPTSLLPEKCIGAPGTETVFVCGAPQSPITQNQYPEAWYMGTASFSDSLWGIDIENKSAQIISNLLEESGRELDVSKIGISSDGNYLYFINKNDNTLWVYSEGV